ncbi:MAG: N-6 DNA methylase [Paludibacteraceae bacterium]|nr:N-6 DNA methylase [Paludibacteraceae bacterium]
MAKKSPQSVEPNIADLANGWLKSYKLAYKLEQESLNTEIDKALDDYFSKNGGAGGNRPDAKLLLQDSKLNFYPILIEYKGYKDKLVKLDENGQVENSTAKNEPNFKHINSYAVNGAVHYANAILHHTSYTDIIAIGITGHKDDFDTLQHQIGVYYVSKTNFGVGQKVGEYDDLSFLASKNFDAFIERIKALNLSQEEIDRIKERREHEITNSLKKLNNDIFQKEKGLSETDRLYLVAASIMATLGIPGKVSPLEKTELKSSLENGNTDGDIIMRKISAFLNEKKLPIEKRDMIIRTLENTLTTDNINKVENGESQLKRVFIKIVDDLGIYYKIGLTTDFTGKLFNEMYSWLGWAKDQLNDVVLTPSYVATLLAKLARVNKDSYVWDFATGSAGLLVAAMNEMLIDAKNSIHSPEELSKKELEIKTEQLLGVEWLAEIYMLAVLNMILMGDGSANILHQDSLKTFNGKYEYGKPDVKFPADAFVLNPPYSAAGNGMVFVKRALSMMNKGYAAIIIQNSAGSGKANEYNKEILKNNTLLASIKMPIDLFVGKSSVQTNIYVFRVHEAHKADDVVKFIDFSNDGYTRTNRKKASCNLRDTDHAKERYEELVNVVRFGKKKLHYIEAQNYFEGHIDPNSGADWNQSAPVDTTPTLEDFKKTVADYLAWEVTTLLKNKKVGEDSLGK